MTILAIDIGTTGTKVVLVTSDGTRLGAAYRAYPTHSSANGVVEQEPEQWWQATCSALQSLWSDTGPGASAQLAAVMLSGQMQDLILLDEDGTLGPAILYSDSRATAEASAITAQIGRERLEMLTGNEQGPASVLAKWRWLSEHEPARLDAARSLLVGAHDYVGWRLGRVCGADYTTASTTGLLDLARNAWLHDLLDELGLDAGLLPPLRAAGVREGAVTEAGSKATAIPAGTPILRGVGDLGAATVGAGAGEPGRVYAYLGTSGWIASSLEAATPNPSGGIFTLRHPHPQRFIQVAPMLTAGGNLDWARDALGAADYSTITAWASDARPGGGGVLYLPYLAGERSPFLDPDARGCFIGMSTTTTRSDLARAVLEGTALALRTLCDTLGVGKRSPLLLTGGGAKSALWSQIIADVLQRPVHVAADPANAPARGAGLIAGQALGWYESLRPSDTFFPLNAEYVPDTKLGALYDDLYGSFCAAYPALRPLFANLAQRDDPASS